MARPAWPVHAPHVTPIFWSFLMGMGVTTLLNCRGCCTPFCTIRLTSSWLADARTGRSQWLDAAAACGELRGHQPGAGALWSSPDGYWAVSRHYSVHVPGPWDGTPDLWLAGGNGGQSCKARASYCRSAGELSQASWAFQGRRDTHRQSLGRLSPTPDDTALRMEGLVSWRFLLVSVSRTNVTCAVRTVIARICGLTV